MEFNSRYEMSAFINNSAAFSVLKTDMSILYLLYGLLLVVVFIALIIYSYHPKRKNDIETPKYRMLDDDD